jgi:hypothetical protein
MILKFYLLCIAAGLLFSVIDSLCMRYSRDYQAVNNTKAYRDLKQYREFPMNLKLLAAIIPIFNLIWVLMILLIIRFFLLNWWYGRKKAFIYWLAGTSIKKHFIFKAKLVKKLFPGYKDYYYASLEKRHWNYKLAADIEKILKVIAGVAAADKNSDQRMDDAIQIQDTLSKQEGHEPD